MERQLNLQNIETAHPDNEYIKTVHTYESISINLTLTENIVSKRLAFDTSNLQIDKLILSNINVTGTLAQIDPYGLICLDPHKNNTLTISQLIVENSIIDIPLFSENGIGTLKIDEVVIINSKFGKTPLRLDRFSKISSFKADLKSIQMSPVPLILVTDLAELVNINIPHSYAKQYPYPTQFLYEIEQTFQVKLLNNNPQQFQDEQFFSDEQKTLIEINSEENPIIQYANVDFQGLFIRFFKSSEGGVIELYHSVLKNMNSKLDGGAISDSSEGLYITNTTFINCTSQRFGGAIKAQYYVITNSSFINCSSKIGGAIFTIEQLQNLTKLTDITYTNNTALIAGNDVFMINHTEIRSENQTIFQSSLFNLDRIIQYNKNLKGTELEQVITPHNTNVQSNNITLVQFDLISGLQYIMILKFTDIKTEFTPQTALGNLYDLLSKSDQYHFSSREIPEINQPYLVLQFNDNIDCIPNNYFTSLYKLQIFEREEDYSSQILYGCARMMYRCSSNMISKLSSRGCSYCALGTYTSDQSNCVACNNKLYDQCYANISVLKSSLWRGSFSDSESTIYSCNLNPESCEGENRKGIGNNLCSQGYIGVQCSSCDINGDYWRESYGEAGQFQCINCGSLDKNKKIILILSMCFTLILLVFTLASNYKRMKNQIVRRYLSKMDVIYVGTSFLKLSQMAIYIKILLFNFQIYLTTYYFVNFNKSDNLSFHSQFFSFFNPLQNSSSSSLQCLMKEYFPNTDNLFLLKLQITVLSPVAVNLAVILVLILIILLTKRRWSTLIYVSVHCIGYSVLFVWMQPILQQSIASNQCIQMTSEEQYLILDRKINCQDSSQMYHFRIYSLPALVVYGLLIPLIFFIGLIMQRKNLEKIRTLRFLGFLYDEYKRKYYYWQFIKIFLSQLLTAILQLSQTQSILPGIIYCGLLSVYLIMLIRFLPFQQLSINKTEMVSIVLSILYLLSTLSLETVYSTQDAYESNSISSKTANVFYYSVLICLVIFYIYISIKICSNFFYIVATKLQRFRIYYYLSRYFPSAFSLQNFSRLKSNLKKWRYGVKKTQQSEPRTMKYEMESELVSENQLIERSCTVND